MSKTAKRSPVCFSLALALALLPAHAAFGAEAQPAMTGAQWRVRDVAGQTELVSAPESLAELQLKLQAEHTAAAGVWSSSCTVLDESGRERAVTLALCVPVDACGATWWDDPQLSRAIDASPTAPFANLSDNSGGVGNQSSLYPLAVLEKGDSAIVLACPPEHARLPRFVYDAHRQELRAEFDFGLSPLPVHFKSRADAKVVAYEVPAKWAFREALKRYYDLYPESFQRRVKTAGTWLPFGESGTIANAADFGFAFHEIAAHQVADPIAGRKLLDDDARIGCGSYVYVEPQTYWQQYAGEGNGTYAQRLAQLESEAKDDAGQAQGSMVSGVIRADGRRDLYLGGVAHTAQRPWGSNADPNICDADRSRNWPSKGKWEIDRLSAILGRRGKPNEGAGGVGGVDGVYVDSIEGWGELLNYNTDHWRVSRYPLTFDPTTHRVALLNFWGTLEWVRQMSERSHAHGLPLFANDAFYRRWQMAPYVDVPGREYTWVEDGKLKPVDDARCLFFRAMSGKKPYLMLMNNRYEDASVMEPYFQRSLFYAVFPSMFIGHAGMDETSYFSNPLWYNRDRHLFKKYVPLIRKLDEAGWEPVPHATVDVETVRLERYGNGDTKNLAFTLHNAGDRPRHVKMTLEPALALPSDATASDWITEKPVVISRLGQQATIELDLPPQGYAAIGFASAAATTR